MNTGLMRYAVANTTNVYFQKSNRIPIYQMLGYAKPSPNLHLMHLAGQSYPSPHYFQTQHRIRSLIDRYITVEKLRDRLQDLPIQSANPQPRPWKPINWQTINRNQIIGLDAEVFLSILIGAMDTEALISGYTPSILTFTQQILQNPIC